MPSTTEKYNRWQSVSNIVNHKSFTIGQGAQQYISQLGIANNATVQTQLLDGGGSGNIDFKDPWYPDSSDALGLLNRGTNAIFHTLSSSTSNVGIDSPFKGVFLNQDTTGNNPHYRVRALQSQPIVGFSSYFQNWTTTGGVAMSGTAGLEKPIVFTSSGATVTALYKAHRGSSASDATGKNGQQKLFSNSAGTELDLVYYSAGEIWWTRYNSSGSVVVPETRISGGSGNCTYPSMVKNGSRIYAIWERYSGGQYLIEFRKYDGSSWSSIQTVGTSSYNLACPVISMRNDPNGAAYNSVEVIWNQSSSSLAVNWSINDGSTWLGPSTFTDSGNLRPSVSPVVRYVSSGWMNAAMGLASDDTWRIYLRQSNVAEYRWPPDPSIVPAPLGASSVEKITAGTWSTSMEIPGSYSGYAATKNAHVSQSSSNGRVFVAWQGMDGGNQKIKFINRSFVTGTWSTLYSIVASSGSSGAVITALSNGNAVISYVEPSSSVVVVKWYTSGSMYYQQGQNNSTFVQVSASETSPSTARFVNMATSGTPYAVQNTIPPVSARLQSPDFLAKGPAEEGIPMKEIGRAVSVYDSASGERWIIEVKPKLLRKDGTSVPLSFVAVNDTLPELEKGSPYRYLATQELAIASDADSLRYEFRFFSQGTQKSDPIRLTAQLLDNTTTLAQLSDFETSDATAEIVRAVTVNVKAIQGKEVVFQLVADESDGQPGRLYGLERIFALPSQTKAIGEFKGEVISMEPIPSDLELDQNYPNPFNPSTTISFSLPENGHVTLRVYDMLGRVVAELLNGTLTAGSHQSTFDASKLPTGVYFYRLDFYAKGVSASGGAGKSVSRKFVVAK